MFNARVNLGITRDQLHCIKTLSMKTVRKALALLGYFTISEPEWGLSDLARASAQDKATTLRLLRPLVDANFLLQDEHNRKYRLGHAVLTLARIREACFPLASALHPVLQSLSAEAAELAHAAVPGHAAMMTIGSAEAHLRATRVFLDPSEPLPFHATASGIAYLAFGDPTWREKMLKARSFAAVTPHTPTQASQIRARVELARQRGYAVSDQTFENEVVGIAVPFFDEHGCAQGTLALATPTSRIGPQTVQRLAALLAQASRRFSHSVGTPLHADWERATANLP